MRRFACLLLLALAPGAAGPGAQAHIVGLHSATASSWTPVALRDEAVGPRAFIDDDIEFRTLVSRIQELLSELGLYDGAIDGRQGPLTERAIRLYESQMQLPIQGQPTRQILNHIESVGRASRLVRRIETTRTRAIDDARDALNRDDRTRRLADKVSLPVADPTRDGSQCLRRPSVDCLLEEAFESAKAIADTRFRDWVLGDVAAGKARAGRSGDALDLLRFLEDPRLVISGLRSIASAQAETGRFVEANLLAETIPDEWLRSDALAAVALAEARLGRSDRLPAVVDDLIATMSTSGDEIRAANLLARTGAELFRMGAADQSRRVVEGLRTLLAIPGRTWTNQERLAAELATVLAEVGLREEARAVVGDIKDQTLRRSTLQAIALDLAEAQDFGAAQRTAKEITDPRYRSATLADVALRQARLGDRSGALLTAGEARDAAEQITERFAYAKGFVHSRIVRALIEAGDLAVARSTAAAISDPALRTQGLWAVAVAAPAGLERDATLSDARASAMRIATDVDRVWALAGAALSALRNGNRSTGQLALDEALQIAGGISAAFARANAMTKLAATLQEFDDAPR